MRLLLGLLLALAFASNAAPAGAQTYGAGPVPRSTDSAVLQSTAERREIHERFRLGLRAIERHDWTLAAAEFRRILALHPAEPQGSTARYDLGLAEARLGRLAEAADNFHAALALDPGFLAALANLASVDLLRDDLKGARAAADRLVQLAPGAARALYGRGLIALRSGDNATAIEDFRKLVERNPAYALAKYDLAVAYARTGDYARAERSIRDALSLAPRFARAHFALGTILLHEGKRAEAQIVFEETIRTTNDPSLKNLAGSLRDALSAQKGR